MSFDIEISIRQTDPDFSERLFDALMTVAPDTDPVASNDVLTETVRAWLSIEADDADSAISAAENVLDRAATKIDGARLGDPRVKCLSAA